MIVPLLLVLASLFAVALPAQTGLREFREAVLRGEHDQAWEILRLIEGLRPADRSLYEAATMPPASRSRAMLRLCQANPADGPFVDTALLAGTAALVAARGIAVPGLEANGSSREHVELDVPRTVHAFDRVLVARRASGGDPDVLREVERWLALARVSATDADTVRIASGGALPVPSPLADDLLVRWFDDRGGDAREVVADGRDPVAAHRIVRGTFDVSVPVPPPGRYVLEVRDAEHAWSALRRVVVSDLLLVAQTWPDRVVAAAWLADAPAVGAHLELEVRAADGTSRVERAVTDEVGLASFDLEPSRIDRLVLEGALDGHTARCVPPVPEDLPEWRTEWRAHVAVDRPLYRRGDRVQGRVLLRWHEATGDERRVRSAPYAGQRVEVAMWVGERGEVTIAGRTDEQGVLAFSTDVPVAADLGSVRMQVRVPAADDQPVWTGTRFGVRQFVRPAALTELDVEATAPRDEPIVAAARARWASGGPCAGLAVDVRAEVAGLEHRVASRLGADGQVSIPLHVHELPLSPRAHDVSLTVRFVTPDGQVLTERARVAVPAALDRPEPAEPTDLRLSISVGTPEPRAGEPIEIELAGRPHDAVLVGFGRTGCREARIVRLDADGRAVASFETRSDDEPRVTFAAGSMTEASEGESWRWRHRSEERRTVVLLPATAPLAVEADVRPEHAPGEAAELVFRVVRDGRPVAGATVCVAVVDETLFSLENDRTRDPTDALRATYAVPEVRVVRSRLLDDVWGVVGELLHRGAVPEPVTRTYASAIGAGGGAGGAYGGRSGGGIAPRSDFRTTALFVPNLTTDADGRVSCEITFPDDLTKWRITVVAVDRGAQGAIARFSTRTTLPLSVTPVLPRVLRTGDRLTVDVAARRLEGSAGPARVELTADGPVTTSPASREVVLEPGAVATSAFDLTARDAGRAELTASVTAAEEADAARLSIPVLPDVVERPVHASGLVDGELRLALPTDLGRPETAELVLFANRDALLREAAHWLAGYPYGCVEQTLSRLVPVIAAARARRLAGEPPLDEALALRVEAAMARLVDLQDGAGGGFRWWRGGRFDPGMTGIALTWLALLRDAGVDPARYGIWFDTSSRTRDVTRELAAIVDADGALVAEWHDHEDRPDFGSAELAAAVLRWSPESELALDAVRRVLAHEQALPAGMLARLGAALAVQGSAGESRSVLDRLLEGRDVLGVESLRRGPVVPFPGEEVAAQIAHRLELMILAAPDHEARPGAVEGLLARHADGRFGSTYATAAAFHALTLDAAERAVTPSAEPVEVTVVDSAGDERTVLLGAQNDWTASVPAAARGELLVRSPGERDVFAVLRGAVTAPGSSHDGWSAPLRVERSISKVIRSPVGERSLEPLGDEVPRGEVCLVQVRVYARFDIDYVVLDLPLPAGFEVVGTPSGWDVLDDRAVRLLSRLPGGEVSVAELLVVPARKGEVAWPPATCAAMYAEGCDGASAGARLHVVEPGVHPSAIEPAPLLDAAHLDARLRTLTERLRTTDAESAAKLVRELATVVPPTGQRALFGIGADVVRRFSAEQEVLRRLASGLRSLPESEERARRLLEGGGDALSVLLFAADSSEHADDDRFLGTVLRLLEDREFGGLSPAERTTIVRSWFDELVEDRYQGELARHTRRGELLHSEGPDVPASLLAWRPVLLAAARFPADVLPPFDVESLCRVPAPDHGARPGAQLEWALSVARDIAEILVHRALADSGRALCAAGSIRRLGPALECLDAPERTKALRTLLAGARAVGDDDVLYQWVGLVPYSLGDELAPELLALLGRTEDVTAAAWNRLPPAVCRELPPSAIVSFVKELDSRDLDGVPPERARRAWLLALEDPATEVRDWQCIDALGEEAVAELPPESLHDLAGARRLPELLARSSIPTERLAGWFTTFADGEWRRMLVHTLAGRGVADVEWPEDDPLAALYSGALAARTGDPAAATRLRERLVENDAPEVARRDRWPPEVRAFVVWALTPSMDAAEYLRLGEVLSLTEQQAVLARFDADAWRRLLAGEPPAHVRLASMPAEIATEARDALLALAERSHSERLPALRAILRGDDGVAFLRARARDAGFGDLALRTAIADAVFHHTGVPAELRGADGIVLHGQVDAASLRTRIVREGLDLEADPARIERLLRRCGLLVPR